MLPTMIAVLSLAVAVGSGSIGANTPVPAAGGAGLGTAPPLVRSNDRIGVWTITDQGGPSSELIVLAQEVQRFNRNRPPHPVELLPSSFLNYEERIKDAAAAGTLPCLLEIDGPYV